MKSCANTCSCRGTVGAVPIFVVPASGEMRIAGTPSTVTTSVPRSCVAHRRELDKREVVGGKLAVASCHTQTLLDLVEEPLDQVARPVQIRTEAERAVAIPSWWDVRPRAMFVDQCSNPVGVISTICQEHYPGFQARQERGRKPLWVGFAGCEREPDRRPVAVDHRVNFAGQPARDWPMDCLLFRKTH